MSLYENGSVYKRKCAWVKSSQGLAKENNKYTENKKKELNQMNNCYFVWNFSNELKNKSISVEILIFCKRHFIERTGNLTSSSFTLFKLIFKNKN